MPGTTKVPDPNAWADAHGASLRYFGCRICDLGEDWVAALDQLYAKGFRRTSLIAYLKTGGVDAKDWLTDAAMGKHFVGGVSHERP